MCYTLHILAMRGCLRAAANLVSKYITNMGNEPQTRNPLCLFIHSVPPIPTTMASVIHCRSVIEADESGFSRERLPWLEGVRRYMHHIRDTVGITRKSQCGKTNMRAQPSRGSKELSERIIQQKGEYSTAKMAGCNTHARLRRCMSACVCARV